MQVFNSFQEMAVGTGALQPQSVMAVFNGEYGYLPNVEVIEYDFDGESWDGLTETSQEELTKAALDELDEQMAQAKEQGDQGYLNVLDAYKERIRRYGVRELAGTGR